MRVLVLALSITGVSAFQPQTKQELKNALLACCTSNDRKAGKFNNDCTKDGTHIRDWDVSGVTDFSWVFHHDDWYYGLGYANPDITRWDVSNGEDFSYMFRAAWAFNQDISTWDMPQLAASKYNSMFYEADSFKQNLEAWHLINYPNNLFAYMDSILHFPSWYTGSTSGTCAASAACGKCSRSSLDLVVWGGDRTYYLSTSYTQDISSAYAIDRYDGPRCTTAPKAGVADLDCSAENCVDDNSICCETPCERLTTQEACSAGPTVCWWHEDEGLCERGHRNKELRDYGARVTYECR